MNRRWVNPREADLIVLRTVAETGSVAATAARMAISPQAVRHRLHRLYRERQLDASAGSNLTAAQAVWQLREELEGIEPAPPAPPRRPQKVRTDVPTIVP